MIAGSSLDIDATGLLFGLQVAGYVAVFGLGMVIGFALGSRSMRIDWPALLIFLASFGFACVIGWALGARCT